MLPPGIWKTVTSSSNALESGQTVSQNNNTIGDNNPNLYQSGIPMLLPTAPITITTSDDATANITIEDMDLKHSQESAIDVKGNSKADITVRGSNTINRKDESSPSMIHVSDGDLTLRGDGSLTLSGWGRMALKLAPMDTAATPDREKKVLPGSIHITDDVTISADKRIL